MMAPLSAEREGMAAADLVDKETIGRQKSEGRHAAARPAASGGPATVTSDSSAGRRGKDDAALQMATDAEKLDAGITSRCSFAVCCCVWQRARMRAHHLPHLQNQLFNYATCWLVQKPTSNSKIIEKGIRTLLQLVQRQSPSMCCWRYMNSLVEFSS